MMIVMQILFYPTFIVVLFPELKALPFKTCTDDQYKRILDNGSAVCVDCLRCPMGLGPSVECGSTISAQTKIECQECRAGVKFSSLNDFEQCQSCSVCSDDQVSKPCTPVSDTVCEKRCFSKDKYYEKTSDDCQDCTWCCGDGNDIVINECLQKGMPAQKSCTVHRKKLCKAPITSPRPTTALPTTLPPTTAITKTKPISKKTTEDYKNNWQLREPRSRKPSNNTSNFEGSKTNKSSSASASTVELEVFIGVCCGLGSLFIIATLVWLLMRYHKRCCLVQGQSKLRVIYTKVSKEDKYSIINTYKECRLFDLLDANPKLKEEVCAKLDLNKSYAKLARRCKVEEDKVRKLEEHPGNEPTQGIFDYIQADKPGFSMGEFAEILKDIKKNDVLECCVKELLKLQPSEETQVVLPVHQ